MQSWIRDHPTFCNSIRGYMYLHTPEVYFVANVKAFLLSALENHLNMQFYHIQGHITQKQAWEAHTFLCEINSYLILLNY